MKLNYIYCMDRVFLCQEKNEKLTSFLWGHSELKNCNYLWLKFYLELENVQKILKLYNFRIMK